MTDEQNKLMEACFDGGKHPLKAIHRIDYCDSSTVVRWCPICGSVVIDVDYDGRTNAGQVMKMIHPKILNT